MRLTLLSLLTVAGLGLSTVAFAASPQDRAARADTNQDGRITQAEFMTQSATRFSEIDKDRNGLLSEAERKAHKTVKMAERRAKRFARQDTNGDGFISRAEAETTAAQKDAKRAEKRESRKAERETRGDKPRAKRDRADGEKAKRPKRVQTDANGDGFISLAEHEAKAAAHFARADKNGDGVLTADEMKRGKRKMRRRGRK